MRSLNVKWSTMLKSKEFAEQIQTLNDTTMERAMAKSTKVGREFSEQRNVPHPMYVSQWLTAVASNRSTVVNQQFPMITKKMRDEIIKGKTAVPFRRSGFYTTMKVLLQLGLTIELGEERGKFVYKLVMLSFMLPAYNEKIDVEIAVQMMAKIARRMDKIQMYANTIQHQLDNGLVGLKNSVILTAQNVLQKAHSSLEEKFREIQENEKKTSHTLKAMPKMAFDEDIIHAFPNTIQYIRARIAERKTREVYADRNVGKQVRHRWGDRSLPDVRKLSSCSYSYQKAEMQFYLSDVENWVLYELDNVEVDHDLSKYLQELASGYMSTAVSCYRSDGVAYSQMVLTMLKIIQVNQISHRRC